jgi:branched-chain amino acid transport system permease protein
MESFLSYTINGLLVGGVYALVGLGIVLIYKATHIFNFAVGQMALLGAFFTWSMMQWFGIPTSISIIVGMGGGWLLGMLTERLAMRRLIGQPLIAAIMATLALSVIFRGVVIAVWGASAVPFPKPIFPTESLHLGMVSTSATLVGSFLIAMLCFGAFVLFFRRSGTGLAMRGVAEDHQVSRSLGVRVTSVFSITWAIAGMVAAAAGICLADRLALSIGELPAIALKSFPAVLLGGLDSIPGVIVGGLIIGLVENLTGGYISAVLGQITPWILLMVVLMIRPEGLWGLKRIERI